MEKYYMKNGLAFIIREGNGEDSSNIISYIDTIASESDYLTFGEGEFTTTIGDEERFIEKCKISDNSLFLIAEYEDSIIGGLTFVGGNRSRINHYGEVGISVLKEFWNQGIGKALMKYLVIWARESGIIRKINLKVRSDNSRAIILYRKLGFVREGTIERFFYHKGKFYDVYVMGLKIN